MALNFTVSYTFSPSTTISSSQVNTNTSDVSNVFTGLEALTKTLAKLKVDVDPTTALEVATKQYVDHYSIWRRPVLKFGSITTVSVESGLDGTSGDIPILFPDGTVRTETSATRTTFDITRNAVLVTSGAQSGLTGATSEANNTWYALYAVKVTDSSTLWVTVGSTVLPLQANFSTLNTAYGANGWVYLGLIRNGDNSGTAGDILSFTMSGCKTHFTNTAVGQSQNAMGIRIASSASSANLSSSYSAGTGATNVPNNVTVGVWVASAGSGTGRIQILNSAGTQLYGSFYTVSSSINYQWEMPIAQGTDIVQPSAGALDVYLSGFYDGTLGVGSNPIL